MFVLHTLCTFIILINLASFPIGTLAVPSVALESVKPSDVNGSTVVIELTVTSATLTDTTNQAGNSTDLLVEKLEANLTTTTTTPTTTTPEYDHHSLKCKSKSEVYSNCSNSCPASCEDSTRKPCRNFCWNGCECAPGYVKNHRWQCIPVEDCPKCGLNEHYRNCGSNCEPTCDTYQNVPVYCSNRASCKRGCFCDYGFVRDVDKNNTCVPIDQCPQKCGPNEYWDVNGEPCIRSQDNPRPKCLFETPKPSCVCNTGYKRNSESKLCEPISPIAEKLEAKCSLNETYSHCDSECARNCFDDNKRQMCPTICHRGCFCKDGFRREGSGRCVLPEECSSWGGYGTPVFVV